MDRTERFYRIVERLKRKGSLTRREVEEELEISHATFKRDVEYLRDRLNVPIQWSRQRNAYELDPAAQVAELPGVWFSSGEIYALLEIEHLIGRLEPGLLRPQLEPLRKRLEKLLGSGDHGLDQVRRRIRILAMGTRRVDREVFESLSVALMGRKRVSIQHMKRSNGETTERVVSPQRLTHYRYNWYLDAWCHTRKDIRVFSVDAIASARVLDEPAREIDDAKLDAVLGGGYGIFAGAAVDTAVLLFSPARARWVAQETWHSQQVGTLQSDGSYRLEVPYSQEPELIMDVLRYGSDVEVLGPSSLRERVADELRASAARYGP
ncbi:MAG: YafY family transcriptional regulator [Steroidobacteraceae bacterium]|nr:YafY family transcriptional regulator [Steroidobacteraceae bacterium]MCC7200725.1 YafY family transcriptional regulator [Gammaproteobacteria bacterium]